MSSQFNKKNFFPKKNYKYYKYNKSSIHDGGSGSGVSSGDGGDGGVSSGDGGDGDGSIVKRKYLIIVESPSKCKKIEEILGKDYRCIASKGHLRELKGLKSINTKTDFEITFSIIKDKENHIQYMKQHIDLYHHDNIFLATDNDREGEAIAWHISHIFHFSILSIKRITFNEITSHAILYSLLHPSLINIHIVHAQHARQVLDLLVGFTISPFLWKLLSHHSLYPFSAGRCQTPALRLIYDNQNIMDSTPHLTIKYITFVIRQG